MIPGRHHIQHVLKSFIYILLAVLFLSGVIRGYQHVTRSSHKRIAPRASSSKSSSQPRSAALRKLDSKTEWLSAANSGSIALAGELRATARQIEVIGKSVSRSGSAGPKDRQKRLMVTRAVMVHEQQTASKSAAVRSISRSSENLRLKSRPAVLRAVSSAPVNGDLVLSVDQLINESTLDSMGAINLSSPLESLAEKALDEAPLELGLESNHFQTGGEVLVYFNDGAVPQELKYQETVPLRAHRDFYAIHDRFDFLTAESEEALADLPAVPTRKAPVLSVSEAIPSSSADTSPKNTLVQESGKKLPVITASPSPESVTRQERVVPAKKVIAGTAPALVRPVRKDSSEPRLAGEAHSKPAPTVQAPIKKVSPLRSNDLLSFGVVGSEVANILLPSEPSVSTRPGVKPEYSQPAAETLAIRPTSKAASQATTRQPTVTPSVPAKEPTLAPAEPSETIPVVTLPKDSLAAPAVSEREPTLTFALPPKRNDEPAVVLEKNSSERAIAPTDQKPIVFLSVPEQKRPEAPIIVPRKEATPAAVPAAPQEPTMDSSVPPQTGRAVASAFSGKETPSAPAASSPKEPELVPSVPSQKARVVTDTVSGRGIRLAPAVSSPKEPVLVSPGPSEKGTGTASPLDAATEPRSVPGRWDVRAGGKVYGVLHFDSAMADWLEKAQGHVELYLRAVGSRDPQDVIFIDYQFPAKRFELDAQGLEGEYHLLASVYIPREVRAIGEIQYDKPISVENYKEKVIFKLTKDEFDQSRKRTRNKAAGVSLTVSVFEGAAGDYRNPPVIAGARLRFVGVFAWGSYLSDSEGTIRVPRIPTHSELLVEVTAGGYFPSYRIVPVFDTSAYAAIYLVSRDKVDTITQYFTKSPQKGTHGILMGRVFDPKTRRPLAGESVSLSFRKGRAIYFGAFPDPKLSSTSDTGMFGFFNVLPSFRSIEREGNDKRAYLTEIRANSASYIEIGRGGKRDFVGKLQDPFTGQVPPAKIRLVGDPDFETHSAEDGSFTIDDIDIASGVITVEVEAPGYPRSWHTQSWNVQQPEKPRTLFLMDRELIESAKAVAGLKMTPRTGSIVGGAENSLFGKGATCARVRLLTSEGQEVPPIHGPYPLSAQAKTEGPLCLTSAHPGFGFYNLTSGQYLLVWENRKGVAFRTRVIHVGIDRVSFLVN